MGMEPAEGPAGSHPGKWREPGDFPTCLFLCGGGQEDLVSMLAWCASGLSWGTHELLSTGTVN